MKVTVEAEPLNVKVDALALIQDIAATIVPHYKSQFIAGNKPEGGARPRRMTQESRQTPATQTRGRQTPRTALRPARLHSQNKKRRPHHGDAR